MSRTIKAIERHLILPVGAGRRVDMDSSSSDFGRRNGERKLVAEWQRGAEILGHAQRKLRLTFTPGPPHAFATC